MPDKFLRSFTPPYSYQTSEQSFVAKRLTLLNKTERSMIKFSQQKLLKCLLHHDIDDIYYKLHEHFVAIIMKQLIVSV